MDWEEEICDESKRKEIHDGSRKKDPQKIEKKSTTKLKNFLH